MQTISDALAQPIFLNMETETTTKPQLYRKSEISTLANTCDEVASLILPENSLLTTVQIGKEDSIFWMSDDVLAFKDTTMPTAFVANIKFKGLSSVFPSGTLLHGLLRFCHKTNQTILGLFDILQIGSESLKNKSSLERHVILRTMLECDGNGLSPKIPNYVCVHWVGFYSACRQHVRNTPWPNLGIAFLTFEGLVLLTADTPPS